MPMTEVASVLFGREDVRRRVQELGRTITGDYVGREPVFVTVLKGGAMFLADLIRAVDLPLEAHLMAISRYGDAEESFGRVQILLDIDVDLSDRDVILVEDIVDTGLTSRYLMASLRARGAASVELCTLLDKVARRIVPLRPSYAGFECPDAFVIGYGLDFQERYRNLPDILQVHDLAALRADPDALVHLVSRAA
jgi:hypoxanthine phosphoribosyltransferase